MAPTTRYRAEPAAALTSVALDAFVAFYHRPSGATHLLASPAPEILAASAYALSLAALHDRLAADYDLADADPAALAARVTELVEAGLLAAA